MSTFRGDPVGAEREIRSLFLGGSGAGRNTRRREGILLEFAQEVERLAKSYALRGYSAEPSRIESPGRLQRSIKVSLSEGPGELQIFIEASRFREWHGVTYDVARIINLGHGEIRPRNAKYLRFQLRGGKWMKRGPENPIRQVGEYPFLFYALEDANRKLEAGTRFRITRTERGLPGAPPERAKFRRRS